MTGKPSERERGILSKRDRQYLLGHKSYDDANERRVRQEIRTRIRESIQDFTLLQTALDHRDQQLIFDPHRDNNPEFSKGLVNLFTFLYRNTQTQNPGFAAMLRRGVRQAERDILGAERDSVSVEVEFSVNRYPVHKTDFEQVETQVRNRDFDEIDEHELRAFLRLYAQSGELDETVPRETAEEIIEEMSVESNDGG
ncbi:hypothetical protein [Natronomonas sp.]|uniref:hypothetical protein n=1 Tax=Natronomonas sp. TaxID=2184060 RepID=UPI00262B4AB8|nr:hypothetical protein [Natronomonas sp.]